MMWMILQADKAEDWVIATGKTTTIRDFVKMAFLHVGIELDFIGNGINEKAIIKSCNNSKYQIEKGKEILSIDSKYFRPTEVELLIGDSSKARKKLGWKLEYDLPALVEDMMQSDLKLILKDQYLNQQGYETLNYDE